jgi:hypothetical protein
MNDQEEAQHFEGVVIASRYDADAPEKPFLGAALECGGDAVWILSYGEQSPYHAFAGRHVAVEGRPYTPQGQRLVGWRGKMLGHLRVDSMRVMDAAGAGIVQVGPERRLRGRFERISTDPDRRELLFMTSDGDTFHVVNDPAGATVSADIEVSAFDVNRLPLASSGVPHLWVVCPHSIADLWEWRRRSAGASGAV